MTEHTVEFVQIALVLHQCRAREIIKILDLARGEIGVHGLHQRQIFAQRHRDARLFQLLEKSDEHEPTSLSELSDRIWVRRLALVTEPSSVAGVSRTCRHASGGRQYYAATQ